MNCIRSFRSPTAALSCALLVVIGCGGGISSTPESVGLTGGVPPTRRVHVIPDELTIDVEEHAVHLNSGASSERGVEPLAPGDIIVGTLGEGYVRRVESVEAVNGEKVIVTSAASLVDAVQSGTTTTSIPLQLPTDSSQLSAKTQELAGNQKVRVPSSSLDIGTTLNLQPTIDLAFSPTLDLDIDIQHSELQRFLCQLNGRVDVDVDIEVVMTGASTWSKEWLLHTFHLNTSVIAVGPVPVVVVTDLDVVFTAQVAAEAAGSLKVGCSATADLNVGVAFDDGWRPIGEPAFSLLPHDVVYDPAAAVTAEFGVKLQPHVKLYGVVGPTIEVMPYLSFEVVRSFAPPEVVAELGAAVSGEVSVDAKLFGDTIASVGLELFDVPLATLWHEKLPIEPLIVADAGPDRSITDADGDGFEFVTLSAVPGAGNMPGVAFSWREGAVTLGNGSEADVELPVGVHEITLFASWGGGELTLDGITVTVQPGGHEFNEIVTPPTVTGPSGGYAQSQYCFAAVGAQSSLGHAVELQVDWGDGAISDWGNATRCHTYASPGTYQLRARARCELHPDQMSDWSSEYEFPVEPLPPEEVCTPTIEGPGTCPLNVPCLFTFCNGCSSLGHPVLYTVSVRYNGGVWSNEDLGASCSYQSAFADCGTWEIRAQARCGYGHAESESSEPLTVQVGDVRTDGCLTACPGQQTAIAPPEQCGLPQALTVEVNLSNSGMCGPRSGSLYVTAPWIHPTPSSYSLGEGQSQSLTVSLDTLAFCGTYYGQLCFGPNPAVDLCVDIVLNLEACECPCGDDYVECPPPNGVSDSCAVAYDSDWASFHPIPIYHIGWFNPFPAGDPSPDVDWFVMRDVPPGGTIAVWALTDEGPALDLRLRLYAACGGAPLITANARGCVFLAEEFEYTVPAPGDYYVLVDRVGVCGSVSESMYGIAFDVE